MRLSFAQFQQIEGLPPCWRRNVKVDKLQVLNATKFVAVNGIKWRALPERYRKWHTIYTRMMRWNRAGVLDRVFEQLQPWRLEHQIASFCR